MAKISLLKKGNIIFITIIIVLLFSTLILIINLTSAVNEKRINNLILELKQERDYEKYAYEGYIKNDSIYDCEKDGQCITMHFPNVTYKYEIYGINGLLTIRKVDSYD